MKKITLLLFFAVVFVSGQNTKYYSLDFYDGQPKLFTTNQMSNAYLSLYRYLGNSIISEQSSQKTEKYYNLGSFLFSGLFGQPLTHENGHQAILNELNIGSVSVPFFDKDLSAKIIGVRDETLKKLRDTDLPNYIRLHTAGLESDFAYLKKSDAILSFEEDSYSIMHGDYLARNVGVIGYYISSNFRFLLTKLPNDSDEPDELKRDIVGHDIWGMVRHIHRPDMEFHRYTQWNELTGEERNYAKRIGWMSLINLANPNLYRIANFRLSDNLKGNFALGYSLSPFGDYIEENAYLMINHNLKLNPYLRQYFNKDNAFFAGGIALHNYELKEGKMLLNAQIDFWQQPENLSFTTSKSEWGGSVSAKLGYKVTEWEARKHNNLYVDAGISYKTDGFLPEAPSLDDDFRVNVGVTLSLQK